LTGQSTGPITGTVGAVDPEGDQMVYSITQTPLHGSAVVNADGTFSYTPGAGFNGTDTFIVEAVDTGFHINLLDWFRPAGTSGDVTVNQGVLPPRVQFQFAYGSGAQYWSSAARSALESVATALSSYLVVNAPVTVTYAVSGEFNPLSGTLASAGSDLISPGAGFLPTVVQNKILAGTDSNGTAADGTITWNFGQGWALSDPVGYSQYDFQSTALHELLHTLGFMSNAGAPGTNSGTNWLVFDK
ncbi:MAG: Ig-like domain-containing protein, partial [Mycobacterium sp.]